jgi:hypothetical protein
MAFAKSGIFFGTCKKQKNHFASVRIRHGAVKASHMEVERDGNRNK